MHTERGCHKSNASENYSFKHVRKLERKIDLELKLLSFYWKNSEIEEQIKHNWKEIIEFRTEVREIKKINETKS